MKVLKDPAVAKDKKSQDLHKNLAIGFAQAMYGEGISTEELKKRLKEKSEKIKAQINKR